MMIRYFPILPVALVLVFSFEVGQGGDIRVDPDRGLDSNDGYSAPVKTISRSIRIAKPGDTIHLKPGTYRESANFTGKHGQPDRPITLDGHGAVLDGSEPVTSREWKSVSPGLFRCQHLYRRTDDALVGRWYLLWDGNMQRMGRCSKGPSAPLKKPGELEAGEWTYVKEEDSFYLKLEPGQDLDSANIRYPKRSSAVIFSNEGSWITVRNVTGTHVYNDGFNVHGAQRHLVFENIAAIECGDDGFSAHEDGDCHIDGFTSIGNATGLCDTGTSRTYYRNVYMRDCHGFDLYFIGLEHSLENAIVESSAVRAFWLDGARLEGGEICRLKMRNVLLSRTGGERQELRIGKGGYLRARNCTFEGLNVMLTPGGAVDFRQCVFPGGDGKPEVLIFPNTIWRGRENLYDFRSLRVGQTSFTGKTFPDFQKLIGSEEGSRWEPFTDIPPGFGAEGASLEKLVNRKPRP